MAKRLSGSAGTGKKILQNLDIFSYNLNDKSINRDGSTYYTFNIHFGNNTGKFIIKVNKDGTISNNSTLNMDNFSKYLGIYNDSTLIDVANYMISNT